MKNVYDSVPLHLHRAKEEEVIQHQKVLGRESCLAVSSLVKNLHNLITFKLYYHE